MSQFDNENENQRNDIGSDLANQLGNVGKQQGKRVARGIGKKVGKKAAGAIAKATKSLGGALLRAISSVIVALLPYILIIVAVLLIIGGVYYVLFETRGSEQRYSLDDRANNENVIDSDKGYFTSKSLSSTNRQIVNFYSYYAKKSYYQLIGDSKELKQTEGADKITDFYNREKQFYLNQNLLFALDELLFEGRMKYPEQFTKPVYYDKNTLTLKSLTDENGNLVAKSNEWVKGKETQNKVFGVWDYGLAPIFKYDKAIRKKIVEGEYYKKDVWDSEKGKVVTISIDPEEFSETLSEEDIWLIEKAITFVGEFEWEFEDSKQEIGGLRDGETDDIKTDLIKIEYGYYDEYDTIDDYGWVPRTRPGLVDGKPGQIPYLNWEKVGTIDVFVARHTLYKYRRGAVYEVCPHPINEKVNNIKDSYFKDYVFNFESYVPESVKNGFDFAARVGQLFDTNLEIGTKADMNNKNFSGAMAHYDTIKKYADMYGVDPGMVVAKMAQESGGKTNIEDGCMQITGDGTRSVTAFNVQTGKKETFYVYNEADRRDPEKAIHWGVMYFASLLERFEGDSLKALQSYNFDVMIIKDIAPEAWYTLDWMNYREEARLEHGRREGYGETRSINYNCAPQLERTTGKIYGDVCYIENVLRYYSGDGGYSEFEQYDAPTGLEKFTATLNNTLGTIVSFFIPSYGEDEARVHVSNHGTQMDVDWILRLSTAMDEKILFSDRSFDTLNFWEEGFTTAFQSRDIYYSDILEQIPGLSDYAPPVKLSNPIIAVPYGNTNDPNEGRIVFHDGVDVSLPIGTYLYSVSDGVITEAISNQTKSTQGMGNYVTIMLEDGNTATYAHMDKVNVSKGQTVKRGDMIGTSGQSGNASFPHLHFSFLANGNKINPTYIVQRMEEYIVKTDIIKIALAQLGKPYVWGSEGPEDWDRDGEVSKGFDCSGFVGYVFYKSGINLGRDTVKGLWNNPKLYSVSYGEIQPEDLLFLDTTGTLAHIGIYIGNGKMIHASSSKGEVVVVNYNDYWKSITHGIKRVRMN